MTSPSGLCSGGISSIGAGGFFGTALVSTASAVRLANASWTGPRACTSTPRGTGGRSLRARAAPDRPAVSKQTNRGQWLRVIPTILLARHAPGGHIPIARRLVQRLPGGPGPSPPQHLLRRLHHRLGREAELL